MVRLDDLPPDQRAVLLLLLKQGKSYDAIAGMLDLSVDAVRTRAHAAVDALGPERGRRLAAGRRALVADYLLGQQDDEEAAGTREHLAGSAGARAWARVVAGELRPLSANGTPEIPSDAGGAETKVRGRSAKVGRREAEAALGGQTAATTDHEDDEADGRDHGPDAGRPRPSSRLGGALLIGGLAVLVVVLLVIVLKDNGDSGSDSKKESASTSTSSTTAQQARPVAQVNLRGQGKALGVAQVLQQGNQRAVAIVGQGLARSTKTTTYAVWLYTSPAKAKRLGYAPAVGKDGKLQAISPTLPADASNYKELVVTSEKVAADGMATSTKPGTVVLRGPLNLPG